MAWHTTTLRLTLFPEEALDYELFPSWRELAADDPAEEVRRKDGGQQEIGPFALGALVVIKHPLRFDLIYAAASRANEPPVEGSGIPNLGASQAANDVFRRLTELVVERRPPTRRLAFGHQMVHPVANREQAYSILAERIATVEFDLQGAEDFVYQINRPRPSRQIAELKVNRLAKWHAIRSRLELSDTQTGQRVERLLGTAAQLDTDINTDAARRERLPEAALGGLLAELFSLSDEIAERGDVR